MERLTEYREKHNNNNKNIEESLRDKGKNKKSVEDLVKQGKEKIAKIKQMKKRISKYYNR